MIKNIIIITVSVIAGGIGALFFAARTVKGTKLLTKFAK